MRKLILLSVILITFTISFSVSGKNLLLDPINNELCRSFSKHHNLINYDTDFDVCDYSIDQNLEELFGAKRNISYKYAFEDANNNEYKSNCLNAFTAFELRMRGYDVTALEMNNKLPIFLNYPKYYFNNLPGSGKEAAIDALLEWGIGARAKVSVSWTSGSAHAFVGINIGDKVIFIDPYNENLNAEEYFERAAEGKTRILRTDNAFISSDVRSSVENAYTKLPSTGPIDEDRMPSGKYCQYILSLSVKERLAIQEKEEIFKKLSSECQCYVTKKDIYFSTVSDRESPDISNLLRATNRNVMVTYWGLEKEIDFHSALIGTNPNFMKENFNNNGEYTMNCQFTAFVYELRRRGFDVTAAPYVYEESNEYYKAHQSYIFNRDYYFENLPGSGKEFIIEKMLEWGDGARGYITVSWAKDGAHAFSVENFGGKVVFVDAQKQKDDVEEYFDRAKDGKTTLSRSDTMQFTNRIYQIAIPINSKDTGLYVNNKTITLKQEKLW